MKAFITGGMGYVGRHLINYLLKENHQVKALVRTKNDANFLQKMGVETYIGDITNQNSLQGLKLNANVVFHLASIFLGPEYEKVVVQGTKNIINISKGFDIRSFIFTSYNLVYGFHNKGLINEKDPCYPSFPEAKYKLKAENILLESHQNERFPIVILRIPSIYGGIDSHFENIFINRIKNGQMLIIGHGNYKTSYVHINDVIQALMLAAQKKEAIGNIFNIAAGDAISMNELCYFISNHLKVKHPKHVPVWVANIISVISDFISSLRKENNPFSKSLIKILTTNGALDTTKAKYILGYDSKYKNSLESIKNCYF